MKANHFGSALSKTPIEEKKIYEKKKQERKNKLLQESNPAHFVCEKYFSPHRYVTKWI